MILHDIQSHCHFLILIYIYLAKKTSRSLNCVLTILSMLHHEFDISKNGLDNPFPKRIYYINVSVIVFYQIYNSIFTIVRVYRCYTVQWRDQLIKWPSSLWRIQLLNNVYISIYKPV